MSKIAKIITYELRNRFSLSSAFKFVLICLEAIHAEI